MEVCDFIYIFSTVVPNQWSNSDDYYGFHVSFFIEMKDQKLNELYKFIYGGNKKTHYLPLRYEILPPINQGKPSCLTPGDSKVYDSEFIYQVQEEIDKKLFPLIKKITSLDDIIKLLEEDCVLERNERSWFRYENIYMDLEILYAYKGWKQKTIDVLEKDLNSAHPSIVHLIKENYNKYLEYFEKNNIH